MVVVATWNVENLYRPGTEFGPPDEETYRRKLNALAATIVSIRPDVIGLQEVGSKEALGDLVELLSPELGLLNQVCSDEPDQRGIRVAVLTRLDVVGSRGWSAFPRPLRPIQVSDDSTVDRMGRGALHVRVLAGGQRLDVMVCHLKSKLISYPGGRFQPKDEGERGRYAVYALGRRAAEAYSVRRLADLLLSGEGQRRAAIVLGDFNDGIEAATTQVVQGPAGSEFGTTGEARPDSGDGDRLWNLAPLIAAEERFSRVYKGRGELIDHIFVSHRLKGTVQSVRSLIDRRLPSIDDDPATRRKAEDSDHAPIVATLDFG
ncbi:endonuclease/exonuclease/phosphatase family protein [Flindersiella endophytica]